jgi:hypothetical protein
MPRKETALDRAKPIEEWDDEELQQHRPRNKHGKFQGRPPAVPPHILRQVRAELNRRKLDRAADIIRDTLEAGVAILGEILADPEARHADKLKATEMLMDRAWGKAVQPLIVGRTPEAEKAPWELAIEDFALTFADEKIALARRIKSGEPTETGYRYHEGTARPATIEDATTVEDEELVREFLDEELAAEYLDDADTA